MNKAIKSGISYNLKKKCHPDEVQTILLIDDAPAHPIDEELCSKNGNVKAIFLSPTTTSLIQSMDKSVIETFK